MKKYNPRSKYSKNDSEVSGQHGTNPEVIIPKDDLLVVDRDQSDINLESALFKDDIFMDNEYKEEAKNVIDESSAPVEKPGAEPVEKTSQNDSVYTIARNKTTGRVEVVPTRSEAEMNMIVSALHSAVKPRKIEMSKDEIEEVKPETTIISKEIKKDEPRLFVEQLRLVEKAIQSLEIELEIMKEVYELEPDEQQRRFHNTRITQLKNDIMNQNRRKNAILNIMERKGYKIGDK